MKRTPLMLAFLLLLPRLGFALPLGSVTVTNSSVRCPPNAAQGAQCRKVQVSCPGTDNITATIGVATPSDPVGTVVVHEGGGGTTFFNSNFPKSYVSHHLRVVQVAWATDWENAGANQPGDVVTAACRVATLFDWVHTTYATSGAYCAQGNSAGSAAIAYSLAHYRLGSEFDAAVLSAGPPLGDIYQGCTAPSSSRVTVCPGVLGGESYNTNHRAMVSGWTHTTTCQNNPSESDEAVWTASSVDYAPVTYDYPQTVLSSFQCPYANEAAGLGTYFWNNVTSAVSATTCDTGCPTETYWYNNTNFEEVENRMETDCVARH